MVKNLLNFLSILKTMGSIKNEFRPTGTDVPFCRNKSSSESAGKSPYNCQALINLFVIELILSI